MRSPSFAENRYGRKGAENFPWPQPRRTHGNSEPSGFPLSSLAPSANPGGVGATGPARGGSKTLRRSIMGNRAVITTPDRKLGLYLH